MFIPAGQAYKAAPDEYAYVHFPVSGNAAGNGTERSCWYGNDYILLARVKRTLAAVTNRSAYEWWAGDGQPWTTDDTKAAKVFEYHHMIGSPHTLRNENFTFICPLAPATTSSHTASSLGQPIIAAGVEG